MRNLYIGHSYHQKTQSTAWFIKILAKNSTTLDFAWDEEWAHGAPVSIGDTIAKDYDHIFVFQVEKAAYALAAAVPERLVYIPMYDASLDLTDEQWQSLSNARIVNFSKTLHSKIGNLGLRSLYTQYFPDPDKFKTVTDFSNFCGFFWARRPELPWPIIKKIASKTDWSQFTYHYAPDPPEAVSRYVEFPPEEDVQKFRITTSRWFKESSDYDGLVAQANVYFAPRLREGIGLAFIEAMARGQCVVAPYKPTHSEYIVNNDSGLLYDPAAPEALDLSRAAQIGTAARRQVELGYSRWKSDASGRLLDYLFEPYLSNKSKSLNRRVQSWCRELKLPKLGVTRQYPPRKLRMPARRLKRVSIKTAPRIAIVTPSYNQGRYLRATIDSVLNQNYPNLDYIVQDGASTDKSLDVLNSYGDKLRWRSEPDSGQSNAINRGFAQVDGDIMAYLNSDDLLLPGSLAYVAHAFKKYPDVDFVYGHRVCIDSSGLEIGRWMVAAHDPTFTSMIDLIPQETMFWRRRVWDSIGPFDDKLKFALDWEFILRAQAAGFSFKRLPAFLGSYRVHEQQKLSNLFHVHDQEVSHLRSVYLGRELNSEECRRTYARHRRRQAVVHFLHKFGITI